MPLITKVPPGRSALIEWDQVAAPTVSITASTRSGSRVPVAKGLVGTQRDGSRAALLRPAR